MPISWLGVWPFLPLRQTQTLTYISDCRISILQWICTYRILQCLRILLEKVGNRYHPWKSHLKFKSKVFIPFIQVPGIREARVFFAYILPYHPTPVTTPYQDLFISFCKKQCFLLGVVHAVSVRLKHTKTLWKPLTFFFLIQ